MKKQDVIVLSDSDDDNDDDNDNNNNGTALTCTEHKPKRGERSAADLAALVRVAKETDTKRGWGSAVRAAPELHPWHRQVVTAARQLRASPGELELQTGASYTNGTLSSSNIRALVQGKWLDDEVINCYLELVAGSSSDRGRGQCLAMSTFFYTALTEHGYDYQRVRKWTRGQNVLGTCRHIVFPVHQPGHWTVAVADVLARRIVYYDSLGRNEGGRQVCKNLLRWILDEEATNTMEGKGEGCREDGKENEEEEEEEEEENKTKAEKGPKKNVVVWQTVFPRGAPLQKNGSDCGVFVCKYTECAVLGIPLTFSQKDMPLIREAMA